MDKIYKNEDQTNLKLLIGLSRSTILTHRRSSEIFKSYGLTLSQFGVLEVLYHKGDMKISEIIKSILSTGGNMTVIINNLCRDGLVKKSINKEDERSHLISITEKGENLIKEIFPKHLLDLQDRFKNLSKEEKEILIILLKKLNGIS